MTALTYELEIPQLSGADITSQILGGDEVQYYDLADVLAALAEQIDEDTNQEMRTGITLLLNALCPTPGLREVRLVISSLENLQ
jgi:hypothetical protein